MRGDKCDFCGGPNPRWSYPAKDVGAIPIPGGPKVMLTGGWGACDACHALIERDDRNGLAEQGARIFRGLPEDTVKKAVVNTQKLFWDNRTGEPHLDEPS
jgi:hypothetical protein